MALLEILLCLVVIVGLIIAVSIFLKRPNKTVYMGTTKEIELDKDITTATPVPLAAATCAHSWDEVDNTTMEMPHEKKHILVLRCRTCGLLDKTIAITSPQPVTKPLPPPPPAPCHHVWETVVNNNLEVEHEKKTLVIMTCKLCGKIEKTVEVTSPRPEPVWTKAQCRHKWDVEKRVILDSAYEQMLESIKVKNNNYSNAKRIDPNKSLDLDLQKAPAWMFKKTYVCLRTCTVCGEIDKTIASNMGEETEIPEEQNV